MKIKTKLLIGGILVSFISILIFSAISIGFTSMKVELEEEKVVDKIVILVSEQRGIVTNYVKSHDSALIDLWHKKENEVYDVFNSYSFEEQEEKDVINELYENIKQRNNLFDEFVEIELQGTKISNEVNALKAFYSKSADIRVKLSDLTEVAISGAFELKNAIHDASISILKQSDFFVTPLIILLIVIVGGVIYMVNKHILKPLNVLHDTADAVAAGDLDRKIIEISNDEVGHVSVAFNEMVGKLKDSYGGLEEKVGERTEELMQMNRRLRAVSSCNQVLIHAEDEKHLVDRVCKIICDEANYRFAWVGYVEHDEKKTVRPVAHGGFEMDYLKNAHITWGDEKTGRGPTGTAIKNARIVYIQDFEKDPNFAPWLDEAIKRGYRSSIALPLMDKDFNVFGVLNIYSDVKNAFTPDEILLLKEMSDDLAFGIISVRERLDHERDEEQLKLNSLYTRTLIEVSMDPLVTIGQDGKITDVNSATEMVTGVSRNKLIGSDFSQYFTDPKKAHDGYQKVFQDGSVKDYPLTIKNVSGNEIDVLYNAVVFKNASGDIHGVFAAARDVTELKRIEDAANKRGNLLAESQRVGEIGSWEWDAVNNSISWSDEIFHIFNVDPKEGTPNYERHLKLYTEESGKRLDEAVKLTMKNGTSYELDLELAVPTEDIRWILARGEAVRDSSGKVYLLRGTAQNITARKLVEQKLFEEMKKLDESKAKDEALLSSIGDGMIATDTSEGGRIIFMNKAAEDIFAFKTEEVIGKPLVDVIKMVDADGNSIIGSKRPLAIALSGGHFSTSSSFSLNPSYYYVRKDGSKFPVALNVTPVVIGGKIIGTVEVFRDITKEKEIDREKSEFVSLASHQLRTPATIVNWYSEMLFDPKIGDLNLKQKEYLEKIYQGNKNMIELINALLTVSRIDLGTFAIDSKVVDLEKVVSGVLKGLAPKLEEKSVIIKDHYEKDLPNVSTDETLVSIVLQNLVINAVEYSPPKSTIDVSIAKNGDYMRITVRDSGCGIPISEQSKIFTKFFRAENARIIKPDGTGLGLYITKSVVEALGGNIGFESDGGVGTTFFVNIPIASTKKKSGKHLI